MAEHFDPWFEEELVTDESAIDAVLLQKFKGTVNGYDGSSQAVSVLSSKTK